MKGWRTVPLAAIADCIDYGLTASAMQHPSGPKFLRITDIQNGAVNWDSVPWCECDEAAVADFRLSPGDIVFARTGATTGKSFLIRECPVDAVFASYLIRVRLGTEADARFVSQFFQTPEYWAQITKGVRGVAQPGVNATTLGRVNIPCPSLSEQRRIAEVLDRADALREKRRATLASIDMLPRAIFLQLFGDPVANPNRWPRARFADLLANIDSGWSPTCLDRRAEGTEWGVLKLGAVTWCEYDATQNKALPADVKPDPELEVKPGDLLFTRKNTYELIAACTLVRDTPARLLMSDLIFRLRLRPDSNVDTTYLHQLLIYPSKRREIQKLAGGTAGSMPNISKARLQTIPIEMPPLPLQLEFSRRIAAVDALKAKLRSSLGELDALFASLQHRAFRGEL